MSTRDWNPIIFSIFYDRPEIFQMITEEKQVYVRNCLTSPFIIDSSSMIHEIESQDPDNEERFIKEKTELFPLVLAIMIKSRRMLTFLLGYACCYLYNEVHLVLLTNFIFES